MIVIEDYRQHRVEINAVAVGDRFNAEVHIRRTLSDEKPHVETVTCLKLSRAARGSRPASAGRSGGLISL